MRVAEPADAALTFRTIDLARDAETAVAFRRDSYACSFGSDERFGEVAEYLDWLRERVARHPTGHVHVWQGQVIVGQMEMLVHASTPPRGYVNLFYLVPEARGRGLGDVLHEHCLQLLHAGGARTARLSVSPSNVRALAYYRKHGWRDLGPRPEDESVRLMELECGGGSDAG